MCFNRPHADDIACYCAKVIKPLDLPPLMFEDYTGADATEVVPGGVLTPELIQECWELMLRNERQAWLN
jgi:hypothetical protein